MSNSTTEPSVSLDRLSAESQEILDRLSPLEITNKDDYTFAADLARDVKTQLALIEAERKRIAGPQYEAWKATNNLFSRVREKYEVAEKILKQKMGSFLAAEKARETALLQEVANGDVTALALAAEAAPTAQGVSERKVITFRVVDESQVPDNFWMLNEKAIGAAVRAGVVVPGIETVVETTVAVAARK